MHESNSLLLQFIHITMRHSMRRMIRYLKENGVSMSQVGTLLLLHRRGACGVSDVGEYLGISAAAASQLLQRLVDDGLIERQEDPDDRRNKRIALTEPGHELVQAVFSARQGWLNQLEETLSEEEHELVDRAVGVLLEKTQELDPVEPVGSVH